MVPDRYPSPDAAAHHCRRAAAHHRRSGRRPPSPIAAGRRIKPVKPVAQSGPVIQVFGREDSAETRAALRFFRERRAAAQFIELRRKPMAPGELRRFVERLGAPTLADTSGRAWIDAGLGYLRMDPGELAARLLADQRLLRLPLVRVGNGFAVGRDEAAWKRLLADSSSRTE